MCDVHTLAPGADTSSEAVVPSAPSAAQLDVLLAPSVLRHRYVRGVDKSLIVERPERIRAVLLGVATAIGKSTADPRLSGANPTSTFRALPSDAPHSASTSATEPVAGPSTSSGPNTTSPAKAAALDQDDLVAQLSSLSVQASPPHPSPPRSHQKFRVLHSTRSLQLDPPHPAVAFTHAHSHELVSLLESAYHRAKQRRRDAHATTSASLAQPDNLPESLDEFKSVREATPTPSSAAPPRQAEASTTPSRTSHAAYLEYLCGRAPSHPPASRTKLRHSSPSKSIPDDSEAYTSSDGEGDDAMYPSEVPEHLPQGDLYLAGPTSEGGLDGGSAEAIRHAMGACCEAVDRVVSAAATDPTVRKLHPLREIRYDAPHAAAALEAAPQSSHASADDRAPAAKRAFVLCRPPGHHCSGSTPQGFCWVNNAIVASAHAYLEHAVDRVVIFDIDLHHGNGTQNLAWRINADANKHDEQRVERLASLRATALDRARSALGPGSGRAHASRVAKVALSDQDEAEVLRQAGPRALRLFYSSLHDIESFPCEDGDAGMIKDASTCVEGAHGQWIWNVHLDHYRSEPDFKRLYDEKYKILFAKAARFLSATSAVAEKTLVLISAGFDACSYEYPGMQRHDKHVPPLFYHMFARDAVHFAEMHARGKLISVLEGGYSDRALCSAALAHVTGLAVGPDSGDVQCGADVEAEYWKLDNLIAVEKVAKKMAAHAAAAGGSGSLGGVGSTNTTPKRRQAELAPWLSLTSRAFAAFEQACGKPNVVPLPSGSSRGGVASSVNSPAVTVGPGRVLRDRGALKLRPTLDAGSTPQARRIGPNSPAKATPTPAPKTESPSKKERDSPIKPHPGAHVALATPLKIENAKWRDTDTPTRNTAHTPAADLPVLPVPSTQPQEKLDLTPVPVLHQLSSPQPWQSIDANPPHTWEPLHSVDHPQTLVSLQTQDDQDQDAEGEPDPDVQHYLLDQQHQLESLPMPGDLHSAFTSLHLHESSVPQQEHTASIYPTLPNSHLHPPPP